MEEAEHSGGGEELGSDKEWRRLEAVVSLHGSVAPPPRLALEVRPAGGAGEAPPSHSCCAYTTAAFDVADHEAPRCPGAKGGSPTWEIDCVPTIGLCVQLEKAKFWVVTFFLCKTQTKE